MAAVEQAISYRKELLPGDTVDVRSAVIEIKDKSLRFTHEMQLQDTGIVAAFTTLTALHLDTTARRACAFPETIREKALQFVVQ